MQLLKFWFGFSLPVNRKEYLLSGLGLMLLRILGDTAIWFFMVGEEALEHWNVLLYLAPTLYTKSSILTEMAGSTELASTMTALMTVWALPFLWIGVNMTIRRSKNAGLSPWLGLLFFLPIVNLLVIAVFCVKTTQDPTALDVQPADALNQSTASLLKISLTAVVISGVFGTIATAAAVFVLGEYGSVLFIAVPFVMGAIAGWLVNRDAYRGVPTGISAALLSGALCFGMLIMFAMEGIICLFMLAPLAVFLLILGACVGSMLAIQSSGAKPMGAMVLALPLIGITEFSIPTPLPVYDMVSEIHIDATPEEVWPNVVGFSELPPPTDWLLKTGIACPIKARIEGEGVGAIRYCEFTTGPFVEPITEWNPPTRLAFDVAEQPEPMAEWSPYEVVYSPHLHDTMMSRRGAFDLIEQPDGSTLLRGTTWYTLDIHPAPYWTLWSDMVVHRIHMRVLNHVKQLSEKG